VHEVIRPPQPKISDQQKYQPRQAVEHRIPPRSRPRWDKALVPFIHRRNKGGPQPGQQCRAPQQRLTLTERRPPTPKQQKAQHPVPHHVPGLAQIVMKDEKVVEIDFTEQASPQRIQHTTGILCREEIGGLKRNQADPDARRPPGAQQIGTGRSRTGRQIVLVPYSAA
jgi:hypothetical protein